VVHDQETAETYIPLKHVVRNQPEGLFTISNRCHFLLALYPHTLVYDLGLVIEGA